MRQSQNVYYMEKIYDLREPDDSRCLANDILKLQMRQVPIKDVVNNSTARYIILRVDLRNASRIHDVGVELIHV